MTSSSPAASLLPYQDQGYTERPSWWGKWSLTDLRHQKNGQIRIWCAPYHVANVLALGCPDPMAVATRIVEACNAYQPPARSAEETSQPEAASTAPAPSLADAARELVAAVGAWPVKMPEGARVANAIETTRAALSAESERERLRREAADRMYDAVRALDDTRDLGACLNELRAAADELRRASR